MLLPTRKAIGLLFIFALTTLPLALAEDTEDFTDHYSKPSADLKYQGKTLDEWLKAIRDRDERTMALAFDALRRLGPEAKNAVPDLTKVVSAPFTPIEIGKDSDYAIVTKLYDIEVRSEAIDALAAIGNAASPATLPLIDWALTIRVVPSSIRNREEYERFVSLVTLDAEYRIMVLHTIRQFGDPAIPTVTRLLRSSDPEKRKLAVLVLGTDVLPIIQNLMNSNDCEKEQLGTTLLGDMDSLVAKAYLSQLKRMVACQAN